MPTVLITGGSRGIGAQIAHEFYQNGWNVVINYYRHVQAAKELCIKHPKMVAIQADVSDRKQVHDMFLQVYAKYPEIDVLVNNAGVSQVSLFQDLSENDWKEIFSVNFFGAVYCIQEVLEDMRRKNRGRIINISSIWGIKGASCESSYASTKAALIGLTKSLAKEFGRMGICVNCVAPGIIQTDMVAGYSQQTMDELAEEVPLGRIGNPKDVASFVLYLSSPSAGYITGQILGVDGGWSIL